MPEKLTWTTEPPAKEGWYWIHTATRRFLAHVQFEMDGVFFWTGAVRQSLDFYRRRLNAQWAGPIPEPEAPEDPKEHPHA